MNTQRLFPNLKIVDSTSSNAHNANKLHSKPNWSHQIVCVEAFLLSHHFLTNSTNKFKASRVRQHTQIQALTLHQETFACTDAKITSWPMSCMMCSLSPSSTRIGPATLHSTKWSPTREGEFGRWFPGLGNEFRILFESPWISRLFEIDSFDPANWHTCSL